MNILTMQQVRAYALNARKYGILRIVQLLKLRGYHRFCIGWVIEQYRLAVGV